MPSAPPPPDRHAALEEARTALATSIRSGFDTLEEAIESALEIITEGHELPDGDELAEQVRAMAVSEVERLRAEQATWPATTDNDRLERAFAALEAGGIVARENFTCCQSCGHAEIGDELDAARERGTAVRGYAFFHQQDTERAVEGGGILLAYGAVVEDVDSAAIGREIAEALRATGLTVNWSGEVSKRIGVPMEWRKRTNAALEE
jgi:hypothetical protein